jgi:cell division protein FtsL
MSTLMNQARTRVPRIAEAAVERARLTVVPRTSARRAARVPFVVLVSLLLLAGVGGLLYFNTSMQQVSFTATRLEDRASELNAERQGLQMDLDHLRNPQRVALQAKRLGMVPQAAPAFVNLSDGTVLGTPTPATRDDAVRLNPLPTRRPRNLKPRIIKVTTPDLTTALSKKPRIGGAAPQARR